MTRYLPLPALVFAVAAIVPTQEAISGTWEGTTRAGASIVLTLAVKESALTGTFVRDGVSATIAEGKVSKNTFTFKATLNDQTETLSGEVTGDEMKIWLDRQGASSAIVLRRAKQK